MWRERDRRTLRWLILWGLVAGVQQQVQQPQSGNINQNLGLPEAGTLFTGTGTNLYYGVNLVPFGPEVGDQEVIPGMLTSGQTIDLHMYFPFYGGLYNYTTISVNGYIGFAVVLDQGPTINIGPDATDWPKYQDPAMIAPYLCKQQIPQDMNPGMRSGVFFRLMMRQSLFGRGSGSNMNLGGSYQSSFFGQSASQACQGTHGGYVRCDQNSDYFLDEMMRWLQEGVAGAAAFRADAALVVTWYNTASAISGRSDMDAGQLSTYQLVWLTDEAARLSYVILNYDKLGFDAADFRANSRSGRCQAVFNGGNHTGLVPVDPTQAFKNTPKVLSQRSGVPHMVRGRYMFRVDDVVRPAGCSNKTGGTYPMLIYPNIVNMMGEMTVDVNAICLDRAQTYILMIEQRQTATCTVLNPSIARCHLPKIYDWGTKTVYFQPQSGGANDEKAFVGYIYFVPPTLDPMRLDIGNIYDWFKNPIPYQVMPLTWYPRNFTNPDIATHMESVRISDDTMYSVQLGLYVIGYREFKDDDIKKFRPEHRVLCRLATYSNRNTYEYRWKPQEERINIYQVEQWYLNDWQRTHELYNYRFGYLKLAPIKPNQNENQPQTLLSGLVSAPISLHWLWTTNNPEFSTTTYSQNDENARVEFVKKKSLEMCHDWYNEDGAQWNFIRDTETNSSCPCIEKQAMADLGRFMPHPRCSQAFRDITCTVAIGARNCYMSAQNIYGSYAGTGRGFESENTARFPTHYGQVCCYDDAGHLMQTSYQPVIKVTPEVPYNPGFPMRAYEFGTSPYMGQYEVPGLSAFHNDYMPYFLCCKFADFRCQMFYWRRPSSGCQEYQPPAYGEGMGAGTFNTIDNDKFIFNEPGVFNVLYIPQTTTTPEVKVQLRLERYPDRRVDFTISCKRCIVHARVMHNRVLYGFQTTSDMDQPRAVYINENTQGKHVNTTQTYSSLT
ncbi:hypothetical protein Y032_0297g1731 [Ancylostoma ceylanicum]|uniref:AMOP domain protein n=1 Tax=Ancylostoma ceylanicum TaxID=53326 RepID=A0A016S495_9BILA|nr:hypothetical protein Y032_0297g1731 [Ancylostoma ceylanicum]